MEKYQKHYDYSTDIIVIFDDGSELLLEDIKDIWMDETGHFVHFQDWYGDEIATISYQKIRYFKQK